MTERQFRKSLKQVFSMAEEMCGSHPPDEIEGSRAAVRLLYKKLLKKLSERDALRRFVDRELRKEHS